MLFPEQLRFVDSKAKYKTAVCSRRAGKTEGCAHALSASAVSRPNSVNLYITLSRKNAKRIVWKQLKTINTEQGLGGTVNESELSITYPNGSVIYLAGVKDRGEIENFRGLALALVIIDEAQALPSYIEDLVNDVISPGLMDYNGSLALIGTPAPVPTGYFYQQISNKKWDHHSWTVWQNPWIELKSGKSPEAHLLSELERRGVTRDHPSIRREWFGEWSLDTDSLVFKFDPTKNTYDRLPTLLGWEYVVGVDLGFEDSDAITVLAFHSGSDTAYLVDELVKPKQTITQLAELLNPMVKSYEPKSIVIDAGGLGKKIAEEIQMRWGIPLKAAEKRDKFGHIELVNDALRTAKLKVKRTSKFASDALLVEWDKDKSTNDKRYISDRYHSDICDALLYAFRESLHWTHTPVIEKPKAGSPAWLKEQEETMRREAEEALTREKEDIGDEEWFYRR